MKRSGVVVCGALALAGAAFAQTQQQKPPIATYWLSAETSAGMPMGGSGMDMAAMMMGGGGGARRSMLLQLGSQQSAPEPAASHRIPPGMKMGEALPLVTPVTVKPEREPTESWPDDVEKPKGRLLIYWGCGEKTRPGQPLVIDFSTMTAGKGMPADLFALRLSGQRPPSPARNRGYGDWPNKQDSTRVPADASLIGDHAIAGNYSPEIRFSVDDGHDFLAPVSLDVAEKTAGGGVTARWQKVPHALGYFATVVAATAGGKDMVMWSSSERRIFGDALMTWLPNADVARLIKEQVVMPPQATECTVPAAVAGAGEAAMMRFIAYGDELNLIHPPRPKDPKVVWEPDWAVKLRQKSTVMAMLGMKTPTAAGRRAGNAGETSRGDAEGSPATPVDAVKEGAKALRGILGF
ncbi:MAG TPA: hypothetical protein VF816_04335 [Rhodocyclaceae bacterium]